MRPARTMLLPNCREADSERTPIDRGWRTCPYIAKHGYAWSL
jgi:hypothetical protein